MKLSTPPSHTAHHTGAVRLSSNCTTHHIFPTSNGHGKIISFHRRLTKFRQTTLDTRKVSLEGSNGIFHTLIMCILAPVVTSIAQGMVDLFELHVNRFTFPLVLLDGVLDGLEFTLAVLEVVGCLFYTL